MPRPTSEAAMEASLPQAQRPTGAGQDNPAHGSGQRAADDLGDNQGQRQRRPALGCSRQDLRDWQRIVGQDVHAHGQEE